jgi:hypothetical protein
VVFDQGDEGGRRTKAGVSLFPNLFA